MDGLNTRSPRRRRVLHVIDSFDLGGAQTALLNLIRNSDRNRYELEVACMHGRGVFWDRMAELGVRVHSLSPRKWWPIYVIRLARLILVRRYHLVHCHLFGANIIAKPVAALLGVRVLISHDQCNDEARHESKLLLWLDKATNRLSSHICAVSKSIAHFLVEQEGVDPRRITVVYNGVELPGNSKDEGLRAKTRQQWGVSSESVVIAGIGRLHPQKHFSLFLKVAATVIRECRTPVYFVLAGSGPEMEKLKEESARLGIGDRVRFLGYVADVREVLRAADMLLLTSLYEGLPLAVLEAMAMKVPVVASKLDGIEEILVDGVDGCLAASGDLLAFVSRVVSLVAEPGRRQEMAERAYKKVRESFSAAKMTAEVERIYDRCLSEVERRDF